MQLLADADLREAMDGYDESTIDSEFLPYVRRINNLQCAITCQCCIGHIPYNDASATDACETKPPQFGTQVSERNQPPNPSDKWGYLSLFMTEDLLETLAERFSYLKRTDWFWPYGSKVWYSYNCSKDHDLFSVTSHGSSFLVFAWDAKHWPKPAEDIVNALERCVAYLKEAT